MSDDDTEYGTKQRLVRLAIWIFAGTAGLVLLRDGGPLAAGGYLIAPVAWGVVGYRIGTAADRVYENGWSWSEEHAKKRRDLEDDEAMTTPGKIFAGLCTLAVLGFLAFSLSSLIGQGASPTELDARTLTTDEGTWVLLEPHNATDMPWPANQTTIEVQLPNGNHVDEQPCETAKATNGTCHDPFQPPDAWKPGQRLYVGCRTQGLHAWTISVGDGVPIARAEANCPEASPIHGGPP